MATNPMQKKSRNAFILGMLLMFVIAALIVAMLYMQIKKKDEEINKYVNSVGKVFTLNQDVKSGQVLTAGMFTENLVSKTAIPVGATEDINTTLRSYSLSTKDGKAIYYNPGTPGNAEDPAYYFIGSAEDKHQIYISDNNGQDVLATYLQASDKAFYYAEENSSQKVNIEVTENAVIAKTDLKANTVITTSLVTRSDEITTDDLKKEEYNVIALPVDLAPGEYVDIRLMLPNGQNYIVVSKKKVEIPVVNGEYLSDTIQMNLNEEEIMLMSGAIVESYRADGAKLYAERYIEAGMQKAAEMTYYPSNAVINAINSDSNIVQKAIASIKAERASVTRKGINDAVSNGKEENIQSKTETSITSTQEQRKNYLQTLPVTP